MWNFFSQLGQIVNSTADTLIAQVQSTARGSQQYIYDGPSSNEQLDPAKFPGLAMQGVNTVGDWFNFSASRDALSQFNGFAIFLRLSNWYSWLNGLFSPYIQGATGQINSYGMGTLTHEILHKQSVGGGFTHDQMDTALTAAGEPAGTTTLGHNRESDGIAKICFPSN